MKYAFPKGSTSVIVPIFIQDSSSTTGAGLGSLIHTSSIVGGYLRPGATGIALAVDEDVATEGTYQAPSAAGKVRIGTPANMTAGVYELHFHNDLFASGADAVFISLSGASNMAPIVLEIQLTDVDLNDAVRGGMTSLPNAAADANNGIVTGDGSVTFTAGVGNRPAVDVEALGGTVQSATDLKDFADAGYDPGTNKVQGVVLTDTSTVNTDLATLFAGITSVAEWLGLIAGKQAGDATAITEIKATGAGSGSYDPTTDSTEALRDHIADGTSLTEAGGDGDHLVEAGGTGDQLTAINLPNQTMDITGSLSGSVGSVSGDTKQTADHTAALAALAVQVSTTGIKKNATLSNFPFVMELTDGTPATGKTVTGKRSLDGGAEVSIDGSFAEVSNGHYQLDALAADTNGDTGMWRMSAAGCKDTFFPFKTVT